MPPFLIGVPMFQAIVIACALGDPTHCIKFENSRFPLETRAACERRAMQMANDIDKLISDMRAVSWRCYKLKEGSFT